MKTKKVLLGSLALAGLCAACTNEEIMDAAQNNNAALSERTQVYLSLSTPSVDSRFGIATYGTLGYTSNDLLGAVLVDKGYATEGKPVWNNVCWEVVDGHVGNNKWAIKDGKFQTAGTTAVGSWVFYTKYNEKMTTTRNGIEFDFPQIQDGAADFSKIYNNNINFMVSPVAHIDGYEGEKLNFNIEMNSVYSYLQMPFDFSAIPAVEQVQKIVVTAKDANGDDFKFPQEYKVVNTALPEAKLSLANGAIDEIACKDLNNDYVINVDDQNIEMQNATKTFMCSPYSATDNVASPEWANFESSTYKPAVEARSEKGFDYLVVDFDGTHTDTAGDGGLSLTNGKFSAYMLMPAGVYGGITFKIYTNDGVYIKTVNDRYAFVENLTAAEQAAYENKDLGKNEIFLRPNTRVAVSDIENVLPSGNAKEYLKVTADDYEAGNLITKTADLINFINGIKNTGSYDANVLTQAQVGDPTSNPADDAALPAHTVVINKAVMDAIVTKETLLGGDIQLVFKGAKMQIKGGTNNDVLDIHDLTFNDDAEIIEGYVKASADVVVPESKSLDIKNSSSLQLAMDNSQFTSLYTVNVEKGSELKVTSNNSIHTIKNEGALAIGSSDNKRGSITTANLTNKGTLRNFNQLNVTDNLTNEADSKLITAGELTIETKAVNNGTLENSKDIKVLGEMTNNSTISNSKGGFIFVTSTSTGKFNNAATGVITNAGRIYTNTGENTIENLGIIEAKEGSTTYITTNSALDEKQYGTNGEGQVMGTIKIEKRNTDISVTTPKNQGYKEYTVAAEDLTDGVLSAVAKDKFNKIVLSTEAELSAEVAEYINFIVTSTNITLPKGDKVQELTFTGNAEIYAETPASKSERVVVSQLKVEENLFVKLPTENALYVFGIKSFENTATSAKIINLGEILVGGNLYTSLSKDEAVATSDDDALFTAGHGVSTAWHWGEQW